MKLTAGRIYDAMNTLVAVANRGNLALPQLAKYRLSKMHDRMLPHHESIQKKLQELVQLHGEEQFEDAEKTKSTGQWGIRPNSDQQKAFNAEWDTVRAEEIDIPLLTPIPYEMLGNEMRGLEMKDFALLGELITEPKES